MSRQNRILSALLLATLPLVACGDDDQRTDDGVVPSAKLSFAALDEAQRLSAVEAAFGMDVAQGVFSLFFAGFDAAAEGSCLISTETESVVTYDAGDRCVAPSGVEYRGSVRTTNFAIFGDSDPEKPYEVLFRDYGISGPEGSLDLDGVVYQSNAGATGVYTSKMDIDVDASYSFAYHLSVELACDDLECDSSPGSFVDIVDLGRFEVVSHMERANGDIVGGTLELRGADTLVLDLLADADNCHTYTLDGVAAGKLCDILPAPLPPEEPEVFSHLYTGCTNDDVEFILYLNQSVESVTGIVDLPDGGQLDIVLTEGESTDLGIEWKYSNTIEALGSCGNSGVQFTATSSDGTTACYMAGPGWENAESLGCEY